MNDEQSGWVAFKLKWPGMIDMATPKELANLYAAYLAGYRAGWDGADLAACDEDYSDCDLGGEGDSD